MIGRRSLAGSLTAGCRLRRPAFSFARLAGHADIAVSMTPSSSPALPEREPSGPVLFFDGECGLCNRIVRLMLCLDRRGRLSFAPLQGRLAQAYLRKHGLPTVDFDTLVYVPDWRRHDVAEYLLRTDGVIAALRVADGGTARMMAAALAILPARVRDGGYRIVARWRFQIFGPWRPRPLLRTEWAARFFE